jgi:hypothetical protein
MTGKRRAALEKSWSGPFRARALPILLGAEPEFKELYDPTMGRPNRSVALVLGTLILKEINDLSDEEAVEALDLDMRWHYAFDMEPEESHLCPKTLHNFREGLIGHEKGKIVFARLTEKLIGALGVSVDRQRLDSTHILSNCRILSRLGLFCETLRVFLLALKKPHRGLYDKISSGILKRHGDESKYRDARRGESRRRLSVVARDAYRLVEQFKGHRAVSKMEEFHLLDRLLKEQCEIILESKSPEAGDDDEGEGGAPVALKEAKDIASSSLQTPHDEGVTYSGHKGQGYEAQIAETCVESNPVELITEVAVTSSSKSDFDATLPMIVRLKEAGRKPDELVADTNYGGAKNAAKAAELGVNLTAPCPANGKPEAGKIYAEPEARCPKERKAAGEWMKAQEAQPGFYKRYAIRAGIEATNSELKRAHGFGKLRVRGEERVKLAVYLKAAACNLKRALNYWLKPILAVEGAPVLA